MDENTKLVFANSVKVENWEDGEKVIDDVAVLREEFRKRLYSQQPDQSESAEHELQAVRAMVKAFKELNTIRARDGVPWTHNMCKASVDVVYFSSVIDELDEVVKAMTGKSAHCHPALLEQEAKAPDPASQPQTILELCNDPAQIAGPQSIQ